MKQPHRRSEVAPADEIVALAVKLSTAYHDQQRFYQEEMGLSATEADIQARGDYRSSEEIHQEIVRTRTKPASEVTWSDLQRIAEHEPEMMMTVWEDLKADARAELDSGHRAGQSMDWQGRPWERARYLAIRQSFHDGSPPQSGVEAALLDTAAEAYSDYLHSSENLRRMVNSTGEVDRQDLERIGKWRPPHGVIEKTIERAERRLERAHKRFLQTIKMVHELQRSSPSLYVTHAGQINVGQQQVNVANDLPHSKEGEDHLPK